MLLIMMIHIILKLRNIEGLWDCDSDAPEILPPSCHMPSPWPGLSGTSVLLRQPTWIYSSSTPEPFNNLCQKRSQTFTDVQKLRHVRIEMKLVYFILFPDVASSLLLRIRFSYLFEVNQLASKKMPSADAAVHLDTSRWESGRLRCQPEQASRLENIASARSNMKQAPKHWANTPDPSCTKPTFHLDQSWGMQNAAYWDVERQEREWPIRPLLRPCVTFRRMYIV